MFYFRLILTGVQRDEEDLLSAYLFENGALGVSEKLDFIQKDPENYQPQTLYKEQFDLEAYFDNSPDQKILNELKSQFTFKDLQVLKEPHKDWLEEWKKGYKAFPLVQDIWVVPSWLTPPEEARKIISIDPGMAFGTGTHETTQVVAQLLQKEAESSTESSVLDVGTGSGILAILAHQLGFKIIHGNDNDPECLRVANENVIINKVEGSVKVLEEDISEIQGSYDIVIANIIDGVLIQIQKDLVRCLKPGGRLIVSGILKDRWPLFKKKFVLNSRLQVKEVIEKGDWMGVTLYA